MVIATVVVFSERADEPVFSSIQKRNLARVQSKLSVQGPNDALSQYSQAFCYTVGQTKCKTLKKSCGDLFDRITYSFAFSMKLLALGGICGAQLWFLSLLTKCVT